LPKLLIGPRAPAAPACCARLPVGGPGSSIRITSAPRSARIIVQNGPGASLVRSSTLIPSSGAGIVGLLDEQARVQVSDPARVWPSYQTAGARLLIRLLLRSLVRLRCTVRLVFGRRVDDLRIRLSGAGRILPLELIVVAVIIRVGVVVVVVIIVGGAGAHLTLGHDDAHRRFMRVERGRRGIHSV